MYSYSCSIGERMPSNQTNLLQGTLDLLILKTLALGEMHGLGISRRIEQVTRETFKVKPGSLFPALHRMQEAGWLESSWGESENNRRAKYYQLTKAGRRQLNVEVAQVKESVRDVRVGRLLESLWSDVRHAWRTILKIPVTAAVVVGSLGVGIG